MADCNSLESLLTNLTNEVGSLKTKIANLESRQSEFATKSELANAIDAVRRLIESVVQELRASIEAAFNKLNEILRTLLGRDNNELEGRVSNLETRVNGLDGITDRLRRTIEGLQRRLTKVESQLSDLANKLGDILKRLSGVESIQGQILMDIKNIYNTLSRHQSSISNLDNQIKLIWAAIAALQAQVAGALLAIANLLRLLKALPAARNGIDGRNGRDGKQGETGRNGRDGKDGRNGTNGRDGTNGTNGTNGINGRDGATGATGATGARGINGRDGRNGADGKNGANGKDLKMEFSTISAKIFTQCDAKNKPVYSTRNIQVIKGTEAQVTKEFEELANMRGSTCASCCRESEGELFGLINISTTDHRFTIPTDAQRVIIEFYGIQSYVSKRFSLLNPKYTNSLGTLSFIIDGKQYPDIKLDYEKMILEVPKAYKNSSRLAYLYLIDSKAKISFLRAKM